MNKIKKVLVSFITLITGTISKAFAVGVTPQTFYGPPNVDSSKVQSFYGPPIIDSTINIVGILGIIATFIVGLSTILNKKIDRVKKQKRIIICSIIILLILIILVAYRLIFNG